MISPTPPSPDALLELGSRSTDVRRGGKLRRGLGWCRANPWPVLLGLLLLAATGASLAALLSTRSALKESEAQREQALKASEDAVRLRRTVEQRLYASQVAHAEQALAAGDLRRLEDLLARLRPRQDEPDLRGWEYSWLAGTCTRLAPRALEADPGAVTGLSCTGDGRLATVGLGGKIQVWRASTGRLLAGWAGPAGAGPIAWAPDGIRLALAGADGVLRVRTWPGGAESLALPGHRGRILALTWSPDGRWLVTGGADQTVRLWDLTQGKEEARLGKHPAGVGAVAFSPDGRWLAIGSAEGAVGLWEVDGWSRTHTIPCPETAAVHALAWSPDSTLLAIGGLLPTVKVCRLATEETRLFCGPTLLVASLAFSPDGQHLAAASWDQTLHLWDVASGTATLRLQAHREQAHLVAWVPEGPLLVSAGKDPLVKVWNPPAARGHRLVGQHTSTVLGLVWGGNDRLASLASGGEVAIWSVTAGADPGEPLLALRLPAGQLYRALAWSPDARRLATGGQDGSVRLWDSDSGKALAPLTGFRGAVNVMVFRPDGSLLAAAGDDQFAHVWNADRGEPLSQLAVSGRPVLALAWSADGKVLATGGRDGAMQVWNADGTPRGGIQGHSSSVEGMAFSPEGRYLASAGADQTARLWDLKTATEVRRFSGHRGGVRQVCWSPDGCRLATAGRDRTVRVWDAELGRQLLALPAGPDHVEAVAWSPDGTRLAAAGGDGKVRVWEAFPAP